MRWVIGAREIMFMNPLYSWIFHGGRVFPVDRGQGIYQPAMNFALDVLSKNGWIHLYPEGRVNQSGTLLPRLKWGVGRLIYDSNPTPLVIPMYHYGLSEVWPVNRKFKAIPNLGITNFRLMVGSPVDFTKIVEEYKNKNTNKEIAYNEITHKIWEILLDLENHVKVLKNEEEKT